jgi:hypothetical protein
VAQVGVGANSSAFKVSRAYIRNTIDHREGIVKAFTILQTSKGILLGESHTVLEK